MTEKLSKLGTGGENRQESLSPSRAENISEGKEILETKLNVSEGINVLGENALEESGNFSEEEKKDRNRGAAGQQRATGQAHSATQVKQLPPVEVMIKETVVAIEAELKKTEDEVKLMMKKKGSSPFELNDKVKRIRFLNGVLSQLKKAAKLAEDFVLGLWKQYVSKSS